MMEENPAIDAVMDATADELRDERGNIRCPKCNHQRLGWRVEGDVLIVDCEDCVWMTETRFDGVTRQ